MKDAEESKQVNDLFKEKLETLTEKEKQDLSDACSGYIRQRMAEPSLGGVLRAMRHHGLFVIMEDWNYFVRFEGIKIHGVRIDNLDILLRCITQH